ncbi:hypothetical protein [Granulicella sp. L60]|uniref:hypothetical protein n=1 Tax=Granulicella sp. L60 TaxID=1641866 RepID=UPI00131E0452|nr:hypothetical protein [Granulicella sp. L60]
MLAHDPRKTLSTPSIASTQPIQRHHRFLAQFSLFAAAHPAYTVRMPRPNSLCLYRVLLVLLCLPSALHAQERPKFTPYNELPLSAEQTAQATGLGPLFQHLKDLSDQPAGTVSPWQILFVRQQILAEALSASLQIDATTGKIEEEISDTRELENYLLAKQQRTVDLLNLASFGIGGSLGTASSALGLTTHDVASNVTGVIAGAAPTVLSLVGLHMQRGGAETLQVPTNMLGEVFDRTPGSQNIYPIAVRKFMNTPAPDDPEQLTREQRLIQTWIQVGRIPPPESKKGQEKIALLTSRPEDLLKLRISDLRDRHAMLYDFRARLSAMKNDIATLLSSLPNSMPQTEQK